MDALRKQLDALMGANRNGDVGEVKRNYWDRDVCKLYLGGLCPHELFQLTVSHCITRFYLNSINLSYAFFREWTWVNVQGYILSNFVESKIFGYLLMKRQFNPEMIP